MTLKQYLLFTVSHGTIARMVPVMTNQNQTIMERVYNVLKGRG